MELREHVHGLIVDALQEIYGLGVSASAGELNTRKDGKRSPLDRLYGGVAVEWEWAMGDARREHGAGQALEYLENLRTHHAAEEAFTAVVADGHQWGLLRFDPQTPADLFVERPESASGHFQWYDNSPDAVRQFLELVGAHKKQPITSRNLRSKFGPESEVASSLVTRLTESIAGRSPGDRVDTLYTEWRRALDVVYGDLNETDSDLAVDVQASYRAPVARPLGEMLFVLHTYFALVGRVIAVELLAVASGELDDAPSTWRGLPNQELLEELTQLERGRLPGNLEITNLFEADLFSWWSERAESNQDLLNAVRELLRQTSELAFPSIAFGPQPGVDVLRDLYQALIPNTLRKALGEFLTPHWLAEGCLGRLREMGADLRDGRVLDPTCGTGTFVVPILSERISRLLREKGSSATANDVQQLLDGVCGIDLNPIAVTATRVNYALALGELAHLGPLTLPVWRADSLVVPEASPQQAQFGDLAAVPHLRLRTSLEDDFTIPLGLNTAGQIAELRGAIESNLVAQGVDDEDVVSASFDDFEAAFRRIFGTSGEETTAEDAADLEDQVAVARSLFAQITDLALEGRDGVWARLIENAYAPIFAGKFDVVVGNPPWLTWTKLPAAWRSQSESLWRRSGLWYTPNEANDSFSLQSADIATLVFAVSIERYVADGGLVGLLTPAALINADPGGRGFRQFRVHPDPRDRGTFPDVDVPFRPLWLDDWSDVLPFSPDAANKPVFLIVRRGEPHHTETPGAVWRRATGVRLDKSSWQKARSTLVESKGAFAPVDPATPTSAWRFQDASRPALIKGGSNNYTFGKGLDTRGANGIFFVAVDRYAAAQGKKKSTVRVVNLPSEGRTKGVTEMSGRVESELVYPLLRGKDVTYWVAEPQTFFLLPHDPKAYGTPLSSKKIGSEFPETLTWLKRHRDILSRRKTPPARSWDMTPSGSDWYRVDGALQFMQRDHIVVVRELSARPAAAVVEAKAVPALGGRKVAPLIDHKLMLCATASRAEALYLAAMINSTPMQDLLESFVNDIAVSPKSLKRLPIPDFRADDDDMKELVRLAGLVVESNGSRAADLLPQMDASVLAIISAAADYKPQPARRAARRGRATAPTAGEPALFDLQEG